jgi:hypothetical protein
MPIGLGTAALIGGGVAAAGTIAGSAIGAHESSKASNKAVAAQTSATNSQLQLGRESNALQRDMFNQGMQYNRDAANAAFNVNAPYAANGIPASNALNALLNLPAAPTLTSPFSTPYQPIGAQPAPPSASGTTPAAPMPGLANALQAGAVPFLRLNN